VPEGEISDTSGAVRASGGFARPSRRERILPPGIATVARWQGARTERSRRLRVAEEPGETVVNDTAYWTDHLDALRGILSSESDNVVDPPVHTPGPKPVSLAVRDSAYWVDEPAALREALVLATFNFFEHAMRVPVPGGVEEKRLTLTVEEAAEILGLSRAFAYEAVRRGEIPSIRIGRRILVPKAALDRLLSGEQGRDIPE
jgi:excisionase family DNA binding protein